MTAARFRALLAVMVLILLASVTLGVTIGSVGIPAPTVWAVVAHHLAGLPDHGVPPGQDEIVWELRLPRVLLAAVIGGGLAVVGAALQALVRNPLADPYVFGISSGAGVGATLVIVAGVSFLGSYSLPAAAFLGAVAALGCVMFLSRSAGALAPGRLILAGVAVAYAMSAASSAILYFDATSQADAGKAEQVTFWLLGGLAGTTWGDLTLPAAAVLAGTAVLALQARVLNAFLMGDETAATLGVSVPAARRWLFVLAALMTGVMVAVSGGIGFVGLMVPHAVRLLSGADHRRVIPASILAGAIFLIWADVLGRTVAAPQEIPIGIVTALFGAPFFGVILRARHRGFPGAR